MAYRGKGMENRGQHKKMKVVGIVYSKLYVIYVHNGTTDLKRNGVSKVNNAKK